MRREFEDICGVDRLVHEPARLAILTALSACRSADFLFLQSLTGLTKGNLSSHLIKLEEAGLVAIEKGFEGKVPQTHVHLTGRGSDAITSHWQRLEQVRQSARRWRGHVGHGDDHRRESDPTTFDIRGARRAPAHAPKR